MASGEPSTRGDSDDKDHVTQQREARGSSTLTRGAQSTRLISSHAGGRAPRPSPPPPHQPRASPGIPGPGAHHLPGGSLSSPKADPFQLLLQNSGHGPRWAVGERETMRLPCGHRTVPTHRMRGATAAGTPEEKASPLPHHTGCP